MKWLLTIVLVVDLNGCFCQTLEETIASQLELLDRENENEPDETYLEEYAALLRHPININHASAAEWNLFPFISPLHLKSLARYRELFGDLVSIYELQAVPLWNAADLQKIAPYITVQEEKGILEWKNLWKGESLLLLRNKMVFEKKKGFSEKANGYTGSPHHILLSYRYRFRKLLDAGIVCEKDPGEMLFRKKIKTFDFVSFHLYKRSDGFINTVALGDFTVNYGQGLIHWQARSFGKSSVITALKKEGLPILPYASSNESNFHRGLGLMFGKRKVKGSAFFSFQRQSASMYADSAAAFFSAINTSGLHRTETELLQRKNLGHTCYGMNLQKKGAHYKAGINFIRHRFSQLLQPAGEWYNTYDAKGRSWFNGSMDYELTLTNMHFFGEAAIDQDGDPALIAGMIALADRNLDLSFLYRCFSKGYRAPGANAFAENSSVENESGFFAGLCFRPTEMVKISGYLDFFRFPWLKYRVDRPSQGEDYLVELDWKPSRQVEAYIRYKSKTKEINTADETTLHQTTVSTRKNLKVHITHQPGPNTHLKAGMETVWNDEKGKTGEEGFLGFAELAFRPLSRLSLVLRLAYFETESFDTRVYIYESGLPYSSEIPVFDGKGFRYYLTSRFRINKLMTIACKFSQTVFYDKEVIGSGLEEIRGSGLRKLEIQFQYAF